MAIIPSFFMDAVVALGESVPNRGMVWIGTGFLIGKKEADDPEKSTVYIVTNKHVVNGKRRLFVRFNNHSLVGVQDLPLNLYYNDDGTEMTAFSEHPRAEVDIVAIQIVPQVIIDNHLSLSWIDIDTNTLTLEAMEKTGVGEGNFIYSVGFPMNLVNDSVKAPVCRLGCISRVADAFIDPVEAAMFLVDAATFPGNSGGPIFTRPEHVSITGTPSNTNANLIGVVSAYISYSELLISTQTGRERMVQEENSGLTIVHPVDRIKEVIEIEWDRNTTKTLGNSKED